MDCDNILDESEVEGLQSAISKLNMEKRLDVTNSRPEFRYSDISVDDVLTIQEMPLLENEQTWLYYEEGQDPNERVDVYGWLNMPHFNDDINAYSFLSECDEEYGRVGHVPQNSDQKVNQTFKIGGNHHSRSMILLSGENSTSQTSNTSHGKSRDIFLNKSVQTKQKNTFASFECEASLIENISSPSLSLLESITMSSNVNRLSKSLERSSYEENYQRNLQFAKLYHSPVAAKENFQPVSMSTPTHKTGDIGVMLNQSYEDLDCEHEGSRSFRNDQRTNIIDSKICTRNFDSVVPSSSTLSKSDPSLLESVQDITRSKSLKKNYDLDKYKLNRTYDNKNSSNNTSVKTQLHHKTFTLDHDDDNASSASDSSHKSSSLIRSLGDVRSLARQQEETLMSSNDVSSGLKKGLSDDCSIHISSADSCTLKTARSSYGSASSINNNNNNNANSNVTGSYLKRPRYGLSFGYGQGQRVSRSGPVAQESGIRMPGIHSASSLRGSSVRAHVLSRIPRSLSRLPTPNIGSNTPSSRGSWRDGCY